MDFFQNTMLGFQVIANPINLLFCFIGVLIGTLVGVLPGIGPLGTIALLLPATMKSTPTASIIMLAGVYYGAQYGGSTTSILVNIPGESSTVMTCLDGYQMALKGRAGPALAIAAWGSFIAGTLSIIFIPLFSVPLAGFALRFGPPEYFALTSAGIIMVAYLAQGSILRALMMAVVGLLVGSIGLDIFTGLPRFNFGIDELVDGIGIAPLAMGLFGISEIFINLERSVEARGVLPSKITNLWPSLQDWSRSIWAILRGSVLGFFLGIIPGAGALISSFASYAVEKRVSNHPEEFGKGAIEGVAGPESANNAATGGAMIPLLSLGIPSSPTTALLLAVFLIHGIRPGPLFITDHPDIFYGLICSMYVGNVLLLILNLPLVGLWVKVLKIPYRILFPLILLLCLIGAYSIDNSAFDTIIMLIFGILGYFFKKFGYEGAPLILAFVLGPILEQSLRQSLLISKGSFMIFFTRPISGITLGISGLLLLSAVFPYVKKRRQEYNKLKE